MEYLPFSQACENNKLPILDILANVFSDRSTVLEIGSGTGQHAVYFAEQLPQLIWQPSDQKENLDGIQLRLNTQPQNNLCPAIELDVSQGDWPLGFDAVFSANTAHIMPWEICQTMLREVAQRLPENGIFSLYGPFNYDGNYTSDSNKKFDSWLKNIAEHQGIRDFETVNKIIFDEGMHLLQDYSMPANNRLLVWKKTL